MVRKETSEKFQPRMVASFNKMQLEQVFLWMAISTAATGLGFVDAVNVSPLDEKGKSMSEKGRKRLTYGLATINILRKEGMQLDQIRGTIQVWQTAPNEDKIEIRYDTIQPRSFGLRRN